MNRERRGKRLIVFAAATLIIVSTISVAVIRKKNQTPKPRKEAATFKAESVTSLPQVSSKVKGLEISSVRLINQGTPQAALAIAVLNNTDQPVMSLNLTAGDANDSSALGLDGLDDPLKPHVIIEPHSLKTMEWGLGSILEGYPILVSTASFGDGREEGDSGEIELMHRYRARSKAKREGAAKKEDTPQ